MFKNVCLCMVFLGSSLPQHTSLKEHHMDPAELAHRSYSHRSSELSIRRSSLSVERFLSFPFLMSGLHSFSSLFAHPPPWSNCLFSHSLYFSHWLPTLPYSIILHLLLSSPNYYFSLLYHTNGIWSWFLPSFFFSLSSSLFFPLHSGQVPFLKATWIPGTSASSVGERVSCSCMHHWLCLPCGFSNGNDNDST